MVDYQNPAVIEKDFQALVKLWHVVNGIFIWEFVSNLDYEWSVVRGRRRYRWTIWVYSLTRLSTLIAVILNMFGLDSSVPINCQAWVIFDLLFSSLSVVAASLLIIVRIIAIWDRNKIAVAIAMCAWIADIGVLIHGFELMVFHIAMTRIRVAWVPEQRACRVLNTESPSVTTMFVTDVVLLVIMLVGLLRLRLHVFGLGELLWKQGLIWLLLATAAEGLPAVFILLNLNAPLSLMFQTPAVVAMSIAATRMHRALTDFSHSVTVDAYSTRREQSANPDPNRKLSASIPLDRVEVALHTSSGDCLPTKTDQNALYSAHIQSQDKPLVLSIGGDIENGVERG